MGFWVCAGVGVDFFSTVYVQREGGVKRLQLFSVCVERREREKRREKKRKEGVCLVGYYEELREREGSKR